jgi:hypothetical protein
MRFQHIAARLSFVLLLVSAGAGLVAGLGTRFNLWNYNFGIGTIFPWCLYTGLGALAAGLIWIVSALASHSGVGARYALVGVAGSIAVLWVPLHDLYLTNIERSIPPIHDISTDTEHPPTFVVLRNQRTGATNSPDYDGAERVKFEGRTYTIATLQKLYYGEIKSDPQIMTPAKLFHRAVDAAHAMGWNIAAVAPDAGGGRIEATDQTLLFGLTDDIVIRVRPAGIGARLDIRSESRVGICDFGRNAARILAYIDKLGSG